MCGKRKRAVSSGEFVWCAVSPFAGDKTAERVLSGFGGMWGRGGGGGGIGDEWSFVGIEVFSGKLAIARARLFIW